VIQALQRLLEASIMAWHLDAQMVIEDGDGAIELRSAQTVLRITPAPAEMPFRWTVMINGRRRTAASVNGVLRMVRQTLSPGYVPRCMRVGSPVAKPQLPS
jgi:hypothetical protein